jgi:GNAT superfamily N-acetyltransferase
VKLQARPYRDLADLARMRQLVMVGSQANLRASYLHPGSLDWATHYPPHDQAMDRNLRLWERVDTELPSLAAWAIHAHKEGSFDLFVHPALYGTPLHESVMDEYVAWAEVRARELGLKQLWPFWAMEYDEVLARLHQAHGYVEVKVEPAAPLFARSLDELPTIQLPPRFTVQEVGNAADGRLRAAVTYAAFGLNDDWEGYAAAYSQFIGSAVYDGTRDLFVRAPDGRGVSACTIWLDPINAIGLFEPVGTHPDFQGRGLGKAVMAEGMRRMQAAGMQQAIVGFDPNNAAAVALYTALGFRAEAYFTFPRKEL